MTESTIEIRLDTRRRFYPVPSAARAARVTISFVDECERENLIQATVVEGEKGYDDKMVCRLIRIRHFYEDLGFDLNAIDFILRMRRCVTEMQARLDGMQAHMHEREEELLNEIRKLKDRRTGDSR